MKVEIEISEAEYEIIESVAKRLGRSVQDLIQQEVDASLTSISTWIQRASMILK